MSQEGKKYQFQKGGNKYRFRTKISTPVKIQLLHVYIERLKTSALLIPAKKKFMYSFQKRRRYASTWRNPLSAYYYSIRMYSDYGTSPPSLKHVAPGGKQAARFLTATIQFIKEPL